VKKKSGLLRERSGDALLTASISCRGERGKKQKKGVVCHTPYYALILFARGRKKESAEYYNQQREEKKSLPRSDVRLPQSSFIQEGALF